MKLDDNDFGFSLVDDDFVPPKAKEKIENEKVEQDKKLSTVMEMILPFINNLTKQPEKTTIYWPNRVEKMTEFRDKLLEVAGSDWRTDD